MGGRNICDCCCTCAELLAGLDIVVGDPITITTVGGNNIPGIFRGIVGGKVIRITVDGGNEPENVCCAHIVSIRDPEPV